MIDYTPELERIINWPNKFSRGKNLLICASAGTGKTTALSLVYKELEKNGAKALVLTFSRQGNEQFKKLLPQTSNSNKFEGNSKSSSLASYTFDSFALLCLHEYLGDYFKKYSLADLAKQGGGAFLAMQEVIQSINQDHYDKGEAAVIGTSNEDTIFMIDLVNSIKISMIFANPPFDQIEFGYEDDFDEEMIEGALESFGLPFWTYKLFHRYEQKRERLNLMHWVDYSYDLTRNLHLINRYIKERKIEFVLVDEFHDTKQVHFEILKAISAQNIPIVAVGDGEQDIYEWRGRLKFSALEEFKSKMAFVDVETLSKTRRFGFPLAKWVQKLLLTLNRESPTILTDPKRKTHVKDVNCKDDWESKAVEITQELKGKGVYPSTIALILPRYRSAFSLCRELHRKDVYFRCLRGILPPSQCREALIIRAAALLHGWYQPKTYSVLDCMAVIEFTEAPGASKQMKAISDLLSQKDPDSFRRHYHPAEMKLALELLRRSDEKLQYETPLTEQTIEGWLLRHRVRQWYGSTTTSANDTRDSFSLLHRLILEMIANGPRQLFEEFDALHDWYNKPIVAGKRVKISTVAQFKGAEIDFVILPCVGENSWQSNFGKNSTVQQRRELYVAMTRTKIELVRITTESPPKK